MNDFEKWLTIDEGIKCCDDRQRIKNPYLKNRLFLAFEAGGNVNPQFKNMQSALMKAYKEIGERRKQVKWMDKQIIKLREELKNKKELSLMG